MNGYYDTQPRRRRFILWPLVIAGLFAAFQYFSSQRYVNPETGRVAHVAMSEGQEAALGLQSYEDVLSQSQVVNSGPEVELVQRVMKRLEAATGDVGKTMDWQVSVVDSPQANAFCLPGGKMVVYTGILPIAQSEAGLATVLGHEIAHATSRHGSQRLLQNQLTQTVMTGATASLALGDMDTGKKMAILG